MSPVHVVSHTRACTHGSPACHMLLYFPTGDAVLLNGSSVTVAVEANDDAGGLFRFSGPYSLSVQEGDVLSVGLVKLCNE